MADSPELTDRHFTDIRDFTNIRKCTDIRDITDIGDLSVSFLEVRAFFPGTPTSVTVR